MHQFWWWWRHCLCHHLCACKIADKGELLVIYLMFVVASAGVSPCSGHLCRSPMLAQKLPEGPDFKPFLRLELFCSLPFLQPAAFLGRIADLPGGAVPSARIHRTRKSLKAPSPPYHRSRRYSFPAG